jgi:hypothetical protein
MVNNNALKLLITGNLTKPRWHFFLPKRSNLNLQITSVIFTQWLNGCCQQEGVIFYRKMSSTPSRHRIPQECERDLFSPNCTKKLHLLYLGVSHSLKAKYRNVFVLKAIAATET